MRLPQDLSQGHLEYCEWRPVGSSICVPDILQCGKNVLVPFYDIIIDDDTGKVKRSGDIYFLEGVVGHWWPVKTGDELPNCGERMPAGSLREYAGSTRSTPAVKDMGWVHVQFEVCGERDYFEIRGSECKAGRPGQVPPEAPGFREDGGGDYELPRGWPRGLWYYVEGPPIAWGNLEPPDHDDSSGSGGAGAGSGGTGKDGEGGEGPPAGSGRAGERRAASGERASGRGASGERA